MFLELESKELTIIKNLSAKQRFQTSAFYVEIVGDYVYLVFGSVEQKLFATPFIVKFKRSELEREKVRIKI